MTTTELAGLAGLTILIAAPIAIVTALEADLHRRRRLRHAAPTTPAALTIDAIVDLADRVATAIATAITALIDSLTEALAALDESIDQTDDTPGPIDVEANWHGAGLELLTYEALDEATALEVDPDAPTATLDGWNDPTITLEALERHHAAEATRGLPPPPHAGPCGATQCRAACFTFTTTGVPCPSLRAAMDHLGR